ncbi:MAG: hypothetical protein BWY20_01281 [Spirochaetes bacterium ADurb.Bin215]|nr:MAG: hypothetical protein BWY20_01281 [Spirochaetes bacterium ADurb.Bin215]
MSASAVSFACMVDSDEAEKQAAALSRSIRDFGGALRASQLIAMRPKTSRPSRTWNTLKDDLQVIEKVFTMEEELTTLPFAAKAVAAGHAESLAAENGDLLVWMDSGSLVLKEPAELLLDDDHVLGCSPVDHMLIGSPFSEPVDTFWEHIYRACGVSHSSVFPVTTVVDRREIRAYFNAGLLVVKPQRGILRAWGENIRTICNGADMKGLLNGNPLHRVFLHQAALAATILARVDRSEILLFPPRINYPLHMHADHPANRATKTLDDVVTCRYEGFFAHGDWARTIPASNALQAWIRTHLYPANS